MDIQASPHPKTFGLPQIINITLENLLQSLPKTEIEILTHIGYLENPSQINGDLEGPLLSVSIHPEEWEAIAELGGCPWWEIVAPNPFLLLDRLKNPKSWRNLEKWGLEQNLIHHETWWKVPTLVGEDGETGYFLMKSKKEAKESEEPEIGKIHSTQVLITSPELSAFWQQRKTNPEKEIRSSHTTDALTCFIIELASHQYLPNSPIGIWWNETFDPGNLSAPRGGLSPHKIHQNKHILLNELQTQ